ncbi:MAG: hypothetical protein NC548_54330 [Lachnospiraceae bacterium]|nr:hypothetical protein [Lachnospiraceae bacterium]
MKENKEYYTIAQALEWLAFRGKELHMYQEIEKEKLIKPYCCVLRSALCYEGVAVYGRKNPKTKHKKLAVYAHCYLDFQNNKIAFDPERERVWTDVKIDAVALKEFFFCPQAQKAEYRTEFMDIMNEIIQIENIAYDNVPKKEWLEKVALQQLDAHGFPNKKTMASYMATFLRPAGAMKGGNKKVKND